MKARFNPSNNTEGSSIRNKRFAIFRETFLNLTQSFYDPYKINEYVNYFAFITGSDVVWAPKRSDNFRADGYFLKFADKGEKRIAYAPSLDCKNGAELNKLKKVYRENLSYLDYLSVRENENLSYLRSLTDKNVSHCLDPALLVESEYYDDMIEFAEIKDKECKYIYVYILCIIYSP